MALCVCVCCVVLSVPFFISLPLSLSSEGTVVGGGESSFSSNTYSTRER